MAVNQEIERRLNQLSAELNECLGLEHSVKSVQILLPVSPQYLSKIKRYSIAVDPDKYEKLVERFTKENEGFVEYSLFYLLYADPFKYGKIEGENNFEGSGFGKLVSQPIAISGKNRRELSNPDKLETAWNRWKEILGDGAYGRSTLWSYIKINHRQLPGAYDSSDDQEHVIVAGFITLNQHVDIKSPDNYRKISIANKKVQDYLHTLTLSLFTEEIEKSTILAKIADIINRNYAHHIGSHVSRRASLGKILERLGITTNQIVLDEGKVASIANMRSRLEKYKDERSEFIASVTSSPVSQTFNFFKDIIRPFVENTLLMDNIARNEGIGYFNQKKNADKADVGLSLKKDTLCQLVIRVFVHTKLIKSSKTKIKYPIREGLSRVPVGYSEQRCVYVKDEVEITDTLSLPYYLNCDDIDGKFYDSIRLAHADIQVNVPGALGKHAIYSLLENYIRNTAKHSYNREQHIGEPIEIILKLDPSEEKDKILLRITDNISDANKAEELNSKIQQSLTDKNSGLGLADMKICASLLAEKELTDDNLKASLRSVSDSGHIAYDLHLTRPKQVALIGIDGYDEDPSNGIYQFETIDSFLKSSSLNFQFAIIDAKSIDEKEIDQYKNRWPLRLFIIDDESRFPKDSNRFKSIESCKLQESNNLLEWCWDKWVKLKKNNDKTHLGIYFEQSKTDDPTSEWKLMGENWNRRKRKPFTLSIHYKDEQSNVLPEVPHDSIDRHIYYDRHAGLMRKLSGRSEHFLGNNFWELIDKNNMDFDYIYSSALGRESFLLPYEMVDAAMTNILVIDERVAEMAYNEDSSHLKALIRYGGFKKSDIGQRNCHLMDACWASGIYIATHIDGKPVSNSMNVADDDLQQKTVLKINFKETGDKIRIESNTNIRLTEKNHCGQETDSIQTEISKLHLQYDCILIHRTKLKEIIESGFGEQFLDKLTASKVFVVTGGGVIDFLTDRSAVGVLPSNILHDYILGMRPAKLLLTKVLK